MTDPAALLMKLCRQDRRYSPEAYRFIDESLRYAQDVLGMGAHKSSDLSPGDPPDDPGPKRHLTGQQLCEAARLYALEQYGYMARCVLNSWGVRSTSDFGEIVYNLIRIRIMRKARDDRREDFDNVFDFETGLQQSFEIRM